VELESAPADAAPEPNIPPELRAKYERAREELRGDRREVVVLFADLSGFTALSERLDPEEVSLVMHGLLGELADVVYRYEGYVDKYIGDAIMALFGAPIAHENDAERAVLAALDMLEVTAQRSDDSDHLLSIRVGLNQGDVVAAHVGSESRQQYTVMGDTVNVASRLEGEAAPDSVLVSQSVYERIGSRFETEAIDPVTVKGKAEPLPMRSSGCSSLFCAGSPKVLLGCSSLRRRLVLGRAGS
jgi:class 3 adenylate cyclase